MEARALGDLIDKLWLIDSFQAQIEIGNTSQPLAKFMHKINIYCVSCI